MEEKEYVAVPLAWGHIFGYGSGCMGSTVEESLELKDADQLASMLRKLAAIRSREAGGMLQYTSII